jgi:hypothetical protein
MDLQRDSQSQRKEFLIFYASVLPLSAFRAARCFVPSIRYRTNLKVVTTYTFHQPKLARHVLCELHPHCRKQIGWLEDEPLMVVRCPR